MKRKEQLQQWLGDRRRTYADGLRLFRALASDAMAKRYSAYLEQSADGVSNPFDPRFTQLVNCLSKISHAIRSGQHIPAAEEELLTVTVPADDKTVEREARQRRIEELKADNEDIATRIGYLEDENGTHADDIAELQEQMEQNLDEIQQLRKDVDQLSAPGVKIVTEESLTPELRKPINASRKSPRSMPRCTQTSPANPPRTMTASGWPTNSATWTTNAASSGSR